MIHTCMCNIFCALYLQRLDILWRLLEIVISLLALSSVFLFECSGNHTYAWKFYMEYSPEAEVNKQQ